MGKWEMVRLGDICEVVSGTTPSTKKPELWNGNVKWIAPAEIKDNSYIIYDTVKQISEKAGLKPMPAGTVLLSSRAPIGKVAIAGCEMCCNQGFKNLICSEKILNRYLYRYLKSKTGHLNELGRGATFKEISKPIVEQIKIPLPPLEIQHQIADVLDRVSTLIEKRKAQIAKLDLLVKSRFVEMFGDPVTNPMRWEIKSIGDLTSTIVAGESLNGETRVKLADEKAVLKVSAVTYGYFKSDEYKVLVNHCDIKKNIYPQMGDLLFSRANTREMVGATALIERDYPDLILPDKLWRLLFKDCVIATYMKFALSAKSIRAALSGMATGTSGSMYNISMEKLRSLMLPVPPIDLQNKFADFVEAADKSKFEMKEQLEKLEQNYKSLMQMCFRGEIF